MAGDSKRRWSELSTLQRSAIFGAAVVQVSLLVAALVDIRRRPAKKVRGSKRLWAAASFVNYVGPLTYFAVGRRR